MFLPQSWSTILLFSASMIVTMPSTTYKWNHSEFVFWDWFISLSKMFSRFLYAVVSVRIFLFFLRLNNTIWFFFKLLFLLEFSFFHVRVFSLISWNIIIMYSPGFLPQEPHEQCEKAKRYDIRRWALQIGRSHNHSCFKNFVW